MFSFRSVRAVVVAGAALPLLLLTSLEPASPGGGPGGAERNRYIGAKACMNCHKSEAKGAQFPHWEKSEHAKAWEVLGTPEAKEVGKKHGVDDPQKSEKCLKCHVTAFSEKKSEIKRGFDEKLGVQCETCHGPGEVHAAARFKAAAAGEGDPDAYVVIPQDEMVASPGPEKCLECHSKESPTFKPFCFAERRETIAHLDPRKERTAEQLAAMKCQCGEACECEQAECSKKDK